MVQINYYNIQALPTDDDSEEIGIDGYQSVFSKLKEISKQAIAKKQIVEFSHQIRGENYISFFDVRPNKKYAKGIIKKFKHIEQVLDVRNNKERHNSRGLGAASLYEYIFVFDYENHTFAIEKTRAPDTQIIVELLTKQIQLALNQTYPTHHLTVDILSDPNKVSDALKNLDRVKKAEINVTFSNSQDWADFVNEDCQEEIERELKENKIVSCEHTEKSSKHSTMKLSKYGRVLIGLSKKFGTTKLQYLDRNNKLITFNSDEDKNAMQIQVSSIGGRSIKNTSYLDGIFTSIKKAVNALYERGEH